MLGKALGSLCMALAIVGVSAGTAKSGSICENELQGNIAWDYSGNTSWGQQNMRRLCAGAENSVGPAQCFRVVMHSGVNWGGGTQWEWENAVNLCRGAHYAMARVNCFQSEVGAGKSWKIAIGNCQASGLEQGTRYTEPNNSTLQDGTPIKREQRQPTTLKLVQNGWYVVHWEVETKQQGYLPSVELREGGVVKGTQRTVSVPPSATVKLKATRGAFDRVIIDAEVRPYGCIILSGTAFAADWTWKDNC